MIHSAAIRDRSYWFDSGARFEEYYSFLFAEKKLRDQLFFPIAGDVFIDVGASGGSWSIPACMLGATVYAFEPNPMMRHMLTQNIRMNECNSVYIINKAVSDMPGVTCFTDLPPYHESSMYSCDTPNTEVTSIDYFLNENYMMSKGLDWLKIDAEGNESKVIEGAREVIEIYKPKIFVENHVYKDKYIESEILRNVQNIRADYDYQYIPLVDVNPVKSNFVATSYFFFF